jgi:Protein of unknown function (DUF3126)
LDKTELRKLQGFLQQAFGCAGVRVALDPKSSEAAVARLGERQIASITVDDEDGDRSFAFAMKIPVGREALQPYLRKLFENEKLKLVARGRKTDSVELNNGEDFLGVISADDAKGTSYTLQIAILDIDLDEF